MNIVYLSVLSIWGISMLSINKIHYNIGGILAKIPRL